MVLKQKYTSQGPIVNVDWFDFANGTGYQLFYAGDANAPANTQNGDYILQSEPFYSDVGVSSIQGAAAREMDFDVEFNRPILVKGDCIINIPHMLQTNAAGTGVVTNTLMAAIQKWDGTTATHLASGASVNSSVSLGNSGGTPQA